MGRVLAVKGIIGEKPNWGRAPRVWEIFGFRGPKGKPHKSGPIPNFGPKGAKAV